MTLIVSWVAIDTHGPSSIYIAADSRISWGSKAQFDYGRKVFACKNSPDIFGYCGDVLFPTMVLAQIIDMADSGLLFECQATAAEKNKAITQKLIYQFANYPHEVETITTNTLEILHASRTPGKSQFECYLMVWKKGSGWTKKCVGLPVHSDLVFARGAGAVDFTNRYKKYLNGPNARTSRNVFHCFCDSLFNTTEPSVGGAPQLVGLIRKPGSNGIQFGIVAHARRYYLGARVDELNNFDRLDWRNEQFELCDWESGKRKAGAQAQPNPFRQRSKRSNSLSPKTEMS